jgi:hypothetical protein
VNDEATSYIIETGPDFYDILPDAGTSDPDTDARDYVDEFVAAELRAVERALRAHLEEVAQDWNAQEGVPTAMKPEIAEYVDLRQKYVAACGRIGATAHRQPIADHEAAIHAANTYSKKLTIWEKSHSPAEFTEAETAYWEEK